MESSGIFLITVYVIPKKEHGIQYLTALLSLKEPHSTTSFTFSVNITLSGMRWLLAKALWVTALQLEKLWLKRERGTLWGLRGQRQWSHLKETTKLGEQNLKESLALHQFQKDANNMVAWIMETFRQGICHQSLFVTGIHKLITRQGYTKILGLLNFV